MPVMLEKAEWNPLMESGEITHLLGRWNAGDDVALSDLMEKVYEDLKQTARRYMRDESPDHTFAPTDLINEAFLRFVDSRSIRIENRNQFFWFAGQLMRRILVEHARAKQRLKRGSGESAQSLERFESLAERQDLSLAMIVALDQALKQLETMDARQSRIVEMRFFAGLNLDEIAEILEISPTTIKREWRMAKHWLANQLRDYSGTY